MVWNPQTRECAWLRTWLPQERGVWPNAPRLRGHRGRPAVPAWLDTVSHESVPTTRAGRRPNPTCAETALGSISRGPEETLTSVRGVRRMPRWPPLTEEARCHRPRSGNQAKAHILCFTDHFSVPLKNILMVLVKCFRSSILIYIYNLYIHIV